MAKRTTGKRGTKAGSRKSTPAKKAAPRRTGGRPAARKRAAARPAAKKTEKRKVAARAAATRKTRRRARPEEPSALATASTAVKGALAGAVAAVTKRLPGEPDAITLLETDHRRLEDLLKRGEETGTRAVKSRGQLLETITAELNAHELIEEKVLYPALENHPEARAIVLEGIQEHHVADVILKELHDLSKSDEQWGAKFKVLKENIEHHIQEEEGPMFRMARGVFSREELDAMGAQMRKMKARAR